MAVAADDAVMPAGQHTPMPPPSLDCSVQERGYHVPHAG
jgi:hypothetical protein